MEDVRNKKKISFMAILSKIGDILMWPIMFIAIFSSFFMIIQKKQNKLTSFFNMSAVNILTGSMVDDGFNVGDTVFTKKIADTKVKIGDVIAFYYTDPKVDEVQLNLICELKNTYGYDLDFSDRVYDKDISNYDTSKNDYSYLEDAIVKGCRIYFHKVVGIYVDDDGNLFFKTKGSSNPSADAFLTRGELIVGRYVNTPVFIRNFISFSATPFGMILLVCIPLCFLILLQLLSLIDQIAVFQLEDKLIKGELDINDNDVKNNLTPDKINIYNKVYYYYITNKEEKETVKQFLWGDILNKTKLNIKEEKELNTLNNSILKLETSDEEFWNEWLNYCKGTDKKKLEELKQKTNPNS